MREMAIKRTLCAAAALLLLFAACKDADAPDAPPEETGASFSALEDAPGISADAAGVTLVLMENLATPYRWACEITAGDCLSFESEKTVEAATFALAAGGADAAHVFTFAWIADGTAELTLKNMRIEGYRDGPDDFIERRIIEVTRENGSAKYRELSQEALAERQALLPVPAPKGNYRTVYEVFVGSFADGDGDGIGDLPGLMQKLDYINDGQNGASSLNATALWLMPVMPSPTYHKYDVTDYYSIDPAYGALTDFDRLLSECSARGVDVYLDFPVNHTSDRHPWFLSACESLCIDDCGRTDGVCAFDPPCCRHNPYCEYYNFTQELRGDRHPIKTAPGWYYEASFTASMPDLNLDNEAVRQEITDAARFWLARGVSGFRLDAITSYYTGAQEKNASFLRELYGALAAIDPDVYLVGEAWTDEAAILQLSGSGIPSLFNFPFAKNDGAVIRAVNAGGGAALAARIAAWDEALHAQNPGAIDAVFLSNHDIARSAGSLKRDPVLIRQAAAVYLLTPGNAFIYYGEELGMAGGAKSDPDKRMPMIWQAANESGMAKPPAGATSKETLEQGVAEQLADADSILRFYIRAINIKNAFPLLASGRAEAVETGEDAVCAYRVTDGADALMVLHNLSDAEVTLPTFPNAVILAALDAGGAFPWMADGALTLPPYSTAILQ